MNSDQRGKRSCLKCDKMFITDGAHHRICSECTILNELKAGREILEPTNSEKLQDIVDKDIRKTLAIKPVKRKCLECDRLFMSEWVGNRICPKCINYRRNKRNTLNNKGESDYGI